MGKTLREILKENHITREQLADQSGVKSTTLNSMITSGVPKERESWIKVRQCLKKDFGIEYVENDGWESTGEKLVPPRKMKPRGAMKNFKDAVSSDPALITKLLNEAIEAYRMPKVRDDKELAERFDLYFRRCAERGQIPTVEEMVMYTGYNTGWAWDVENGRLRGFSSETARIIKQAKETLKMFDAKLVISGKMNFLTYCFRAKNYYGMVDKQEYVVTPNQKPENNFDAEDIRKRYAIETTLEDDEK